MTNHFWLMPMIHWEWREVRWLFTVTWPGQSRQLDGIEAAEAVPLRPPSMPLWSGQPLLDDEEPESGRAGSEKQPPPLVGHAEPVVPYLISAYWTQYLDHVIIQSTEEDVDRGKFANNLLLLPIKVLAKDRVLENVNVKWGIKRYVQNRQRA